MSILHCGFYFCWCLHSRKLCCAVTSAHEVLKPITFTRINCDVNISATLYLLPRFTPFTGYFDWVIYKGIQAAAPLVSYFPTWSETILGWSIFVWEIRHILWSSNVAIHGDYRVLFQNPCVVPIYIARIKLIHLSIRIIWIRFKK